MDTLVAILGIVFFVLIIAAAIDLYFLPTIIADKKKHPNKNSILILNLLLGWTFLGWAGALVWACIDVDVNKVSTMTRNIGRKQI